MSLLETLDDDIADLLGSDNEESARQSPSKPHNSRPKRLITASKPLDRNIKSAKKSAVDRSSTLTKRRQKSMLHSQSNRSLKSGTTDASVSESDPVSMSREDALAMLQSESLKNLNASKSAKSLHSAKSKSLAAPQNQPSESPLDLGVDEHEFDFASPSATKHKSTSNSSSTTDDDSNDSILDWLDEPRAPTQQKRKSLLPSKTKTKVEKAPEAVDNNASAPKMEIERSPDKEFVLVERGNSNESASGDDSSSFSIEQWMEALGMTPEETEQREFRGLAVKAHRSDLPGEWEKVNDNLYHNLRTNERRMSHPMMDSLRSELKALRQQKIAQSESKQSNALQKSTNSTSLSSLTVNTAAVIPSRQIEASFNAQRDAMPSDVPPKKTLHSTKTQITTVDVDTNASTQSTTEMFHHKREAETLIIANLRMELGEARATMARLMKDKTRLMEEMEEAHTKTEILLNEQRQRLGAAHKMETERMQKEQSALRALKAKLLSDHQAELLALESNIRRGEAASKQRSLNELTLLEQRGRDEMAHQMQLHRQTLEEVKRQHQNELEMVAAMHTKQLQSLRAQSSNEGQLDLLITKMESSTQSLHRLQRDLHDEREHTQTARESKLLTKERLLDDKDEELLRERKAHRELLEKFQALVEDTKTEKAHIREANDALKAREEHILSTLSDGNREVKLQRDAVSDERRKFEVAKSRWEKQRANELDDIQRLKSEHTANVQSFYEEQEMERQRMAKQRQICSDDKGALLQTRKELDLQQQNLEAKALALEQRRHALEMESSAFENKVADVTAMSRRVFQQSELVTSMYEDSKALEGENGEIQLQLLEQTKELKRMKQQLLMERHQLDSERKQLETEQLKLMTTKRDLLQQIDTMKAIEQQKLTMRAQRRSLENQKELQQIQSIRQSSSSPNIARNSMQRISSELQELKDFVNECNANIAGYKDEIHDLKHQRHSRSSTHHRRISHSHSHRRPSFDSALRMSFPSSSNKSLLSSTRTSSSAAAVRVSARLSAMNNLSQIRLAEPVDDDDDDDERELTRTPLIPQRIRNNLQNLSSHSNNADSTLSGTFVSMANIDTPITVDRKAKTKSRRHTAPRVNGIAEELMPMTPQLMPNLSEINVTEIDNEAEEDAEEEEALNTFDEVDNAETPEMNDAKDS